MKAPAIMLHFCREIEGGVEFRTRFWMGYRINKGKGMCTLPPWVRIPIEAPMGLAYPQRDGVLEPGLVPARDLRGVRAGDVDGEGGSARMHRLEIDPDKCTGCRHVRGRLQRQRHRLGRRRAEAHSRLPRGLPGLLGLRASLPRRRAASWCPIGPAGTARRTSRP